VLIMIENMQCGQVTQTKKTQGLHRKMFRRCSLGNLTQPPISFRPHDHYAYCQKCRIDFTTMAVKLFITMSWSQEEMNSFFRNVFSAKIQRWRCKSLDVTTKTKEVEKADRIHVMGGCMKLRKMHYSFASF